MVWHMPVDALRDLLTLRDIDEMLPGMSRVTNSVRIIADGKVEDPLSFSRPDGDRYFPGGMKGLEVSRLLHDGGTLVINRLTHHSARIRDFSRRLEFEVGVPIEEVCAFLTPPESRGLGEHGDPDPVLLVQLEGSKTWTIRAPFLDEPTRIFRDDHSKEDWEDILSAEPFLEVKLNPGDVLWIPRGWLHSGSTGSDLSLHMTIGFQTFSPGWLVKHMVDRLLDADPAQSSQELPYGCAFDMEKMQEIVAKTLADFSEKLHRMNIEEVSSQFMSAMSGKFLSPPRAAAEALALQILPSDRFVLNVESILSIQRSPDGKLIARLRDSTLKIPVQVGDFFESKWNLDSMESWTVADVSADINEIAAARLISDLFRAGVVRRSL
jgi:hypothetical protein